MTKDDDAFDVDDDRLAEAILSDRLSDLVDCGLRDLSWIARVGLHTIKWP